MLHQGKDTNPPISFAKASAFNIRELAKQVNLSDNAVIKYLEDFLAERNKAQLITQMSSECDKIELTVVMLFDKLLPEYNRLHAYYGERER